jgi:hypothetical protein
MPCLTVICDGVHRKNVQKGVETVMGGQVLDYEAKRIAREALN